MYIHWANIANMKHVLRCFWFLESSEVINLSRQQVNASNLFRCFRFTLVCHIDHRNKIIMGTEWTKSNVLPEMVKNRQKTSKMVIFSKKVELSAPLQAERNFYGTSKFFLVKLQQFCSSEKTFGDRQNILGL